MAITLEEARKNITDDLQANVIDEFRKSSFIMDNIPFDDVVSPAGGGSGLTYAYTRLITQPTAGFRSVNAEYTPQEVAKKRYTVDLKVFGGSFKMDRIIAKMGGIASEVELQVQQKIKATRAVFSDTFFNGDSAVDAEAFDGLDKAITGSSTEFNAGASDSIIDLSSSAQVDANYKVFLDMLDEFLTGMDGEVSFIAGNTKMIAKIRACARRAGMYQMNMNDIGRKVESYGPVPFIDAGAKPGSNDPIISIGADGSTSLFAGRFGMDGIHGISRAGQPIIETFLPDFKQPGPVKEGEVEMVAAIALRSSKSAGIFRKIKVK